MVARAIDRLDDDEFGLIKKLNGLRNMAAHPRKTLAVDLESKGFAKPIDEMVRSLSGRTLIGQDESRRNKLVGLIYRMAGLLEGRIQYDERERSPWD